MQFQYLSDLKIELKKYAGIMNPDSVRIPCGEAVKHLSEDIGLPIDNSQDPIVVAFTVVLDNKKSNKTCSQLIGTMCNCIKSEVITGEALSTIVRKLETFQELDNNTTLQIIQFSTLIVGNHFLEMDILQSILSLILSYCTSYDSVISTSAIAAADQIISSFLNFAQNKNDILTTGNKRDIDLCFSMSCDKSISFDKHIYKVTYLVLRDLVRMAIGQKTLWLHVGNFNVNVAYGLIENIISNHISIITDSEHFERLFSDAIKASYHQRAPMSFCVTSMTNFMKLMPEACASLFSNFLGDLTINSPMLKMMNSLVFFRAFLLKDASMAVDFYLKCDKDGRLLTKLIFSLRCICEEYSEKINSIDISFKKLLYRFYANQIQILNKSNDEFIISSCIEIPIFFIRSCYKSASSASIKLKIIISKTWTDILVIIQIASSVVTGSCCYILLQELHSLVLLTNELGIDDARGSAISTFCTILVAPKGPEADEVKKTAFETVISAIENTPTSFNGHWKKVMTTLSEFAWIPANYDFTKNIQVDQIIEIITSLFSINDGDANTKDWSILFTVDVLIANISRFKQIWPSIEEIFVQMIQNDESQETTMKSFYKLLREGFTTESEKELCLTMKKLIIYCRFTPDMRIQILEQTYNVLLQSSNIISSDGWISLLNAFLPSNFQNEEKILNSAFRCVQLICNDLMFSLPEETQTDIITLIIEYASQMTDINVSLSSFDFLWNFASKAKTTEMWKFIFLKTEPLIFDTRIDVSVCAVNTFISLIITNSQLLTHDVYDYLATDLFMKIIETFANQTDGNETTEQLTFHELAHCGRTLWDQFKDVNMFCDEFWKKMISEHEKFITRCKKRDILVNSFLFYEELFQNHFLSNEIIILIFDSLDSIFDFFIKNESPNSPIFGSIGRLMRNAVPEQKECMTIEYLKRWLNISEKLIFGLDRDGFLPPTAHKSLDAFILLFPLPDEMSILIYESFVKIASEKSRNKRLFELTIHNLCDICENKVPDSLLSKLFIISTSLFSLKEARRLLLDFVSKDIPINDSMVEDVSNSLMSLGESDSELKLKTASSVLKMFLRLTDQTKLNFVKCYEDCGMALEKLWQDYLDPTSDKYDEKTANLLTKTVVEKVGDNLMKSDDDETIKRILNFLLTVKSNGEIFESDKNYAHLFELLPHFADLVMHPDTEIRQLIRNILILISEQN